MVVGPVRRRRPVRAVVVGPIGGLVDGGGLGLYVPVLRPHVQVKIGHFRAYTTPYMRAYPSVQAAGPGWLALFPRGMLRATIGASCLRAIPSRFTTLLRVPFGVSAPCGVVWFQRVTQPRSLARGGTESLFAWFHTCSCVCVRMRAPPCPFSFSARPCPQSRCCPLPVGRAASLVPGKCGRVTLGHSLRCARQRPRRPDPPTAAPAA